MANDSSRADHLKPHWYKPGQSGNPKGRPMGSLMTRTLFMRALKRFEQKHKVDLFEHFVETARREPSVLIAAMNKLLPNKTEVTLGQADLVDFLDKVIDVVTANVNDPVALEKIADGLEALRKEALEG